MKFAHKVIGRQNSHSGAVLLIVLAFTVLITGVIVAFFSRAISERKVSNSSASQTSVAIFSQGALDLIVSDLKQEIEEGSTIDVVVTGTGATKIFTPKAPSAAMPADSGFNRVFTNGNESDGLNNLVKRSAAGAAFYSSGPKRAASCSTTQASLNGRSISSVRWNKALLLPNGSNSTSVVPDWILVARDGSNPTEWNSDMMLSSSKATSVMGRYAYVIYNVGGLLDVNAAGYPTGMNASQLAYKNSLGFADLTQLTDSAGHALFTQRQIDSMVCWRNYASIRPPNHFPGYNLSGTTFAANYYDSILGNTKGYLTVSNQSLFAGQSDKMFTSRQQLISFLTKGVGINSSALQYLTFFSRDLEQPSLMPDPARPRVISGDGGNDAYGSDDSINPSFLKIRVGTQFLRNNGTQALVGEPLVKKRFALNRLAWLTYSGPSAGRNQSDSDIQAMIQHGISSACISQGTQEAIYRNFGLYWDSTNGLWIYNHNSVSPPSSAVSGSHGILTLSEVAAANREPDFVELLKATIPVGSIAKGANAHNAVSGGSMPATASFTSWEDYQFQQDICTDYAIIQMVANIIDQFDADGYPTRIAFDRGGGIREFAGVENLPYFYRSRPGVIVVQQPNPGTSGTGNPPRNSGSNILVTPGVAVTFLQPEIWNPHDTNSSVGNPRPGSAELRLVADSKIPGGAFVSIGEKSVTGTAPGGLFSGPQYSDGAVRTPAFYNDYQPDLVTLAESNTALIFSDNGGALFREPTLLIQPNVPSGSGLTIDSANNLLVQKFGASPLLSPLLMTGTHGEKYVQSTVGGSKYIGIFLGVSPLRWIARSGTGSYVVSARQADVLCSSSSETPITYRMQYRDVNGNWLTYDQKVADLLGGGNVVQWQSNQPGSYGMIGEQAVVSCIDPRTSRFGMGGGFNNGQTFPASPAMLDGANNVLPTNRSDQTVGAGIGLWSTPSVKVGDFPYQPCVRGLPCVAGWYPSSQIWNTAASNGSNFFYTGFVSQNSGALGQYYSDPDGVVRRAMGGYSTGTATGLPLATATAFSGATSMATAQSQSRPMVLNRPFQSVVELGYVFSGIPWRNLDMFTPESGCAALLDVFCIYDTENPDGLVAGKVSLNTRQAPVLQAILAGAYQDELDLGSSGISASIAGQAANALVSRTASTDIGKGPLINKSDLVGKWIFSSCVNGDAAQGIDGSASYGGFSHDLTALLSSDPITSNIGRFREASLRALSNNGSTRIWNLMIDVVSQTGRYPASASKLADFLVEGEQRYWMHIAIDRCTGQVIDKQIEVVKE